MDSKDKLKAEAKKLKNKEKKLRQKEKLREDREFIVMQQPSHIPDYAWIRPLDSNETKANRYYIVFVKTMNQDAKNCTRVNKTYWESQLKRVFEWISHSPTVFGPHRRIAPPGTFQIWDYFWPDNIVVHVLVLMEAQKERGLTSDTPEDVVK
jgi:hypothetical protein